MVASSTVSRSPTLVFSVPPPGKARRFASHRSSLLVAAKRDGVLRYVGEVSCGLTRHERAQLARRLPERVRPRPVVPCRKQAVWLEPELYCRVRSLGWSKSGRLRGASLAGLIEQGAERPGRPP